ncbi:hypothetical protein [Duganella sp. HH105]|uniref:hypothetical protein n=1 Tax=Duganella sp. HH105 TaxID=1781067 RepID=UPI000892AB49|nr:hypothetical protein [Duganella sp. HH105]OEZ54848.1 hypothetical protein DUGA6_56190 [Duganella sp. HH105]
MPPPSAHLLSALRKITSNRLDLDFLKHIASFGGPPSEAQLLEKPAAIQILTWITAESPHRDNQHGSILNPLTFLHISDESLEKGAHFTLQAEWLRALLIGLLERVTISQVRDFALQSTKATSTAQIEAARLSLTGAKETALGNLHFRLHPTNSRRHFEKPLTSMCANWKKPNYKMSKNDEKRLRAELHELEVLPKPKGGGKREQLQYAARQSKIFELKKSLEGEVTVSSNFEVEPSTITLHEVMVKLSKSIFKIKHGIYKDIIHAIGQQDFKFINELHQILSTDFGTLNRHDHCRHS